MTETFPRRKGQKNKSYENFNVLFQDLVNDENYETEKASFHKFRQLDAPGIFCLILC